MSSSFDTTQPQRFLRPADVARLRRNQRRIDVQRALYIGRNVALALLVILAGVWAWRRIQSDIRFAVKRIEVTGAVHSSRASINTVTSAYVGANLFRLDIARIQDDLRTLPWVSRIEIEKKLPDTLRIRVVERTPVALIQTYGGLRYVDENGAAFAELSPAVGDPDLPLISAASGPELTRCIELIRNLRDRDPEVYSRISEVRPIAPRGFALFDRDLGAVVYANGDDISGKWRSLYAIAGVENFGRSSIQYADLRFADRVVIKPLHPLTTSAAAIMPAPGAQITN